MIYQLIGNLIKLGTTQFFKEIHVTGEKPVEHGPVIIAANHPNQAVDPFLVGTIFNRPLYFLAKSTLFKKPLLDAFFRSMHMLPVYRKQDSSDTALNEGMFKAATEALIHGKGIVIFPEGTSTEARRLLPLKTGAARLALQTVQHEKAADLTIQPVGITYLAPRVFQSSVTISIGAPIIVAKYRELYATAPHDAVNRLTDEIEDKLRSLTVEVKHSEHQLLVERITVLFGEGGNVTERMKAIARKVEEIAPLYPDLKADIERKLQFYCQMRSLFPSGTFSSGKRSFESLLLAPIVLLGALINLPPYKIIEWYMSRFVKDPHDLASLKIGIGLPVYIAWFSTLSIICTVWSGSITTGGLLFILLCLLGFTTNKNIERVWSLVIAMLWVGPSPLRFLESYSAALRQELLDLYHDKENKEISGPSGNLPS